MAPLSSYTYTIASLSWEGTGVGTHLGAAVLAEVGDASGQGRAAGEAAQPHLGKAHDPSRVRARRRQRYAARVRACTDFEFELKNLITVQTVFSASLICGDASCSPWHSCCWPFLQKESHARIDYKP